MKASLPCRGHTSANQRFRGVTPAYVNRGLNSRIRCQPSNDQAGTPAYPADASAPFPTYPMPVPPSAEFATPGTEGSQAVYTQGGYPPYQVPQRQQQYYMAPPPGYYAPPAAPYKAAEASSGAPWWIWVGVGILAANIIGKVQEYMKNPKSPQQMMTEMAMKQMMGAMGSQTGPGGPFGKAGGMPPFPGGGMPPFPPGGFAQAAAAAAQASAPPVDITSSPAATTPSTTAAPASDSAGRKGEKFASRMGSPSSSNPADSTPAKEPAESSSSKPNALMDVVEPIVKEPAGRGGASRSSASFFADVTSASSAPKGSSGSSSAGSSSTGPAGNAGASAGSQSAGSSNGAETGSVMTDMMENMLRNPEMQKMLYPYLPEPMRNPSSIEWMLNNPEVKKQMASMFEQQNMMSPQMMEMMKGMDFNQDKVNKQFQELGLKPEDVITKVMANPELAAGFQNPKVQAAIMDISQSPMNIIKYQSDPEVMKVLEQVTTLFQPAS